MPAPRLQLPLLWIKTTRNSRFVFGFGMVSPGVSNLKPGKLEIPLKSLGETVVQLALIYSNVDM